MDVYGRYIMIYRTSHYGLQDLDPADEDSDRRLGWKEHSCSKPPNLDVKTEFLQDFPFENQPGEMSVLLHAQTKIRRPTPQIQSVSECLFLSSRLITIWGLIWRKKEYGKTK